MKVVFRYGGFDGRVWCVSLLSLLVTGGVCAWLFLTAGGAYYIAAWVTMVVVAIMVLCLLSVPRRIILSDSELELRCLLETTYIPLAKIVDVAEVESGAFRGKIPLVGVAGFWGYYGRWLDVRSWRIHKVYARRRCGCVAIHTTNHRYLVSCNSPQLLKALLVERMGGGRQGDTIEKKP